MLRKMKRRFIIAAMAAFGMVMLVLVVGINVVNYGRMTSTQDGMAESLLEYERRMHEHKRRRSVPPDKKSKEQERKSSAQSEPDFPPITELPGGGPEARFTIRFFAVYCASSGEMEVISRDFIYSIDEETAKEYTTAVLRKNREKGYYGDYRFQIKKEEAGSTVLFLNVTSELRFVKSLFVISLAIGFSSLLVVFVLVLFFSQYAVRPYMKNMERQKRFITDAGHELKTPITSIATSADIAAMEYEDDEWISNIQKQTARLTRLVSELVALSRMDEEIPFPEKSSFSLSDAAWETAEPFAVRARAEGKRYDQNIGENLTVFGDRNSIQQLISILLDNAVKYVPASGEIWLNLYRRRRKVCIEVSNTCELPDTADLDRLFDRFYRVDESRCTNTGGTGIGLAMAQAIAETHGGKIRAERADKNMIRFRVLL